MADEETGSWWQQVTGECILGALKGKRLRRVASDEVTLATWRAERPESTVVQFDPRYRASYPESDWERRVEPVQRPKELVVGVEWNGAAAAWPLAALRKQSPLNTQLGAVPIVLLVGADGNSARCFLRSVDGKVLE